MALSVAQREILQSWCARSQADNGGIFLLRLQWQATGKWLEKEREDHRLEGVAMRVLAALRVLEKLF